MTKKGCLHQTIERVLCECLPVIVLQRMIAEYARPRWSIVVNGSDWKAPTVGSMRFDWEDKTWTPLPGLEYATEGAKTTAQVVCVENRPDLLLLASGNGGPTWCQTRWTLDSGYNATITKPIPVDLHSDERWSFAFSIACLSDGRIYRIGGYNLGYRLYKHLYRPDHNSISGWRALESCPPYLSRGHCACVAVEPDWIIFSGGAIGSHFSDRRQMSDVHVLNVKDEQNVTYMELPSLPRPMTHHSMNVSGTRLWIIDREGTWVLDVGKWWRSGPYDRASWSNAWHSVCHRQRGQTAQTTSTMLDSRYLVVLGSDHNETVHVVEYLDVDASTLAWQPLPNLVHRMIFPTSCCFAD